MSHFRLITAVLAAILLTQAASALTINQPVTPDFLKDNPHQFTITAEKRADGLLHFTITRHLTRPAYLVARTTIRAGDKLLLDTTSTAFAREPSLTYYLAVPPDRIADTTFELFDGTFNDSDGHPVPAVGGTQFQIQLADFAKSATDVK